MRPTDENQHSSNRPNLMSSPRRGGSEENILAKLERDSSSRLSPTARIAWFGTAGALVVALVGTLVWLARDNGRHVDTVLAASAKQAALPAAAAAPVSTSAAVHPHAQGAAIIDNPEPAPAATARAAQPEPPPLVLLSPDEAGAGRGDTLSKKATPQPVTRVREAEPVSDDARPAKAIAQHADSAPARAAAKTASPATPRAAAAPARAGQRVASAKTKKTPAASAAENPVDRDVALISAIIMHSSSHAAEREAAEACAGDSKCAKASSQP